MSRGDDWDDDWDRPRRRAWDDDPYSEMTSYRPEPSGAVTGVAVISYVVGGLSLLFSFGLGCCGLMWLGPGGPPGAAALASGLIATPLGSSRDASRARTGGPAFATFSPDAAALAVVWVCGGCVVCPADCAASPPPKAIETTKSVISQMTPVAQNTPMSNPENPRECQWMLPKP